MSIDFVILIHSGAGPAHYDLMIRQDQALASWRLEEDPQALGPGQSMPAWRIHDHRLDYLDYQGPLSRGRGEVRRLDRGPCGLLACHPTAWEVQLEGAILRGHYRLEPPEPPEGPWTLLRLA